MTASAMETAVAVRPGRYLAGVEIRILGPLEVVSDGGVQPLGGKRERALLAVMALSPGQVLSADRLIDALWDSGMRPSGYQSQGATEAMGRHIEDLRTAAERQHDLLCAVTSVLAKDSPIIDLPGCDGVR